LSDLKELFTDTAARLSEVKTGITAAQEVIKALKEAGEDTKEQEKTLRELQTRYDRWKAMLSKRGISVK